MLQIVDVCLDLLLYFDLLQVFTEQVLPLQLLVLCDGVPDCPVYQGLEVRVFRQVLILLQVLHSGESEDEDMLGVLVVYSTYIDKCYDFLDVVFVSQLIQLADYVFRLILR